MGKKLSGWKTKGMNRDMSVSAFNNEFAYENLNLRLATNENNTLMSWVNERGTQLMTLKIDENPWVDNRQTPITYATTIEGIPIGTAIINHKLVLFTTKRTESVGEDLSEEDYIDYIYTFEFDDSNANTLNGKIIYKGNLNFCTTNPLETLVSYEANYIEKVYWIDNRNQPRIINIASPKEKMQIWNSTQDCDVVDTFFDFVPAIKLNEEIEITKNSCGGKFPPGVIQYAFTYVNKYGQESNVFYTSPLYYITHNDRGGSPDETTVDDSFNIVIKNVDITFDYIRIYSIQRTSLNLDPIIKNILDVRIKDLQPEEDNFEIVTKYWNINYLLPIGSAGFIYGIEVIDGSVSVDVVPALDTQPFSCTLFTEPGFYKDDGTNIFSLRELISILHNNIPYDDQSDPPDYSDLIGIHDSYVEYTINTIVKNRIRNEIYRRNNYGFLNIVGFASSYESNDFIDEISWNDFYSAENLRLVYNLVTHDWAFTIDDIIENQIHNPTADTYFSYTDTGTVGSTVDPYKLLYVGGKEITALTMTAKDQTLFMGNIVQKNTEVDTIQDYFDFLREQSNYIPVTFTDDNPKKKFVLEIPSETYSHTFSLTQGAENITSFKGGETYRFGFQLQKVTGEWAEPIFIDDAKNLLYPKIQGFESDVNLIAAEGDYDLSIFTDSTSEYYIENFLSLYKRVRPVIVFPDIQDRNVLCQGVINPTVFNVEDRVSNSPFAQPSWYFRPYMKAEDMEHISENEYEPITNPSDDILQNIKLWYREQKPTGANHTEWKDTLENNWFSDKISSYYILLVKFTDTPASYYVPQRGFLNYSKNTPQTQDPETGKINYDFYFPFYNPYDNITYYAFAKRIDGWPLVHGTSTSDDYFIFTDGLEVINPSTANTTPFKFYDSLSIFGKCAYYSKFSDGAPDNFIVRFFSDGEGEGSNGFYYKVKFDYVNDYISGSTLITNNRKGTTIRFGHYESLRSAASCGPYTEAGVEKDGSVEAAAEVEIQGSLDVVNSVYGDIITNGSNLESNTQFFIDHSIVTLNSPDIEFDTEAQVFRDDNLKLRIVGTIPITSSYTSHFISATPGLELGFNNESTGDIKSSLPLFGWGARRFSYKHFNFDIHSGRRLVAERMWQDSLCISHTGKKDLSSKDSIKTADDAWMFWVHPWHRAGSLNNDFRANTVAASVLQVKKEANTLYSFQNEYLPFNDFCIFDDIEEQTALTENSQGYNLRFKKQKSTSSEINYYPNIDKVLYNSAGYNPLITKNKVNVRYDGNPAIREVSIQNVSDPIPMQYKSTSHAAIALKASTASSLEYIPILPKIKMSESETVGAYTNPEVNKSTTFWGDLNILFKQDEIDISNFSSNKFNFLLLGELYRDDNKIVNRFGGKTKDEIKQNTWLPAGEPVELSENTVDNIHLEWTQGDTYYQRYDCLKTYAHTPQSINQIIEILSFMCETHVNIDGRYDKNRGLDDNTDISPENFNYLNPVYSQKNNYFSFKKLNTEEIKKDAYYPNYITYSKTKESGGIVDLWTNMTLASTLELDGDKGKIESLNNLNGTILSFQDSGIAQILYNENYQIQTTQGVPIEIANSGKVQGSRYLSNTVGCSNKWSIVQTPSGIYFMDSDEQSIYLFNGQLNNVSTSGGMNTWCKQNIPSIKNLWTPDNFKNFVSYYDPYNQDVMFINEDTALVFSEKLNAFTSFYDYGKTPYFCSLDNTGLWIRNSRAGDDTDTYNIYKHQAGDYYCEFFGEDRPYHTILVGNPEPQTDKIFTNLEFRATVDGDGSYDSTTEKFTPALPFDYLEAWNEYQHGITKLEHKSGTGSMSHNMKSDPSTLKRKFRMWRCDIPRDNTPASANQNGDANRKYTLDSKLGISRYNPRKLDRIRNPWVYIKLLKEAPSLGHLKRAEIHDILITFFS